MKSVTGELCCQPVWLSGSVQQQCSIRKSSQVRNFVLSVCFDTWRKIAAVSSLHVIHPCDEVCLKNTSPPPPFDHSSKIHSIMDQVLVSASQSVNSNLNQQKQDMDWDPLSFPADDGRSFSIFSVCSSQHWAVDWEQGGGGVLHRPGQAGQLVPDSKDGGALYWSWYDIR